MAITLQDLRMVDAIARESNLSRAAASLGLTQPALSWAVKKLETELELKLFHRTKKGVLPTRNGQTFLGRAKSLLSAWEELKHNLHEDDAAIRGSFSLGVHGTLAAYTLPKFTPTLLSNCPNIDMQLTHDLSRHISQGVIDYRFDYGIVVNPPQHLDLVQKELYLDRVQFWVAAEPSILQQPTHSDAVWICNPDMFQTERLLKHVSRTPTWQTRRIIYTTDLLVITAMVAAGGGIGLLPASFAKSYHAGSLKPLKNSPYEEDVISLVWRNEAQKSAASKMFRKVIIESLKSLGSVGEDKS